MPGIVHVSPTEITPGSYGSYVEIDLTAHVPESAAGVVLLVVSSESNHSCAVREAGGSDDEYRYVYYGWTQMWCKVSASNKIEAKIQSSSVHIYINGYIPSSSGAFFSTPIDITPGVKDSWEEVDLAPHCGGSEPSCAFFRVTYPTGASANPSYGVKPAGMANIFTGSIVCQPNSHFGAVTPCSGGKIDCLVGDEATYDIVVHLMGYLNTNVITTLDAREDIAVGGAGWTTIPVDTAKTDSAGAFITFWGAGDLYVVRKKGETISVPWIGIPAEALFLWVGLDALKQFEERKWVENVSLKLFGYDSPYTPPPPASMGLPRRFCILVDGAFSPFVEFNVDPMLDLPGSQTWDKLIRGLGVKFQPLFHERDHEEEPDED